MNEETPTPMRCKHPGCKPMGPCPHCGAAEAGDWVRGYHGWECGTINAALHGNQSIFHLLQMTAPQRAEAFLRTVGKWQEPKEEAP